MAAICAVYNWLAFPVFKFKFGPFMGVQPLFELVRCSDPHCTGLFVRDNQCIVYCYLKKGIFFEEMMTFKKAKLTLAEQRNCKNNFCMSSKILNWKFKFHFVSNRTPFESAIQNMQFINSRQRTRPVSNWFKNDGDINVTERLSGKRLA